MKVVMLMSIATVVMVTLLNWNNELNSSISY